jgi:transposase-like protein
MARKKMITTHISGESQRLFVDEGALARMIESAVRLTLEEQMDRHIGAGAYERTSSRRGYRNGSKPRTMKTAVGNLHFDVPQARDGGFRPSIFERYQRSDRAFVAAMQEMVVQGVSTRRVGKVLEEMAGFEVSAATVSRAMAELDEEIARFRSRPLSAHEYPFIVVDARYEKVRVNGRVVSQAVLVVAGITDEGRREMLGYWLADSESESTWSEAFADLKRRGMQGVSFVISDAHRGIRAAVERHFQGAVWQRCRVHFKRELYKKVHWRDQKELMADVKAIFVSDEREQCLRAARDVADRWRERAPRVARAIEEGVEDCLAVQALPCNVRRRLKSTNMIERQMREFKRRTRVVSIFPNVAAAERMFGALIIELDELWATEPKRYINTDWN